MEDGKAVPEEKTIECFGPDGKLCPDCKGEIKHGVLCYYPCEKHGYSGVCEGDITVRSDDMPRPKVVAMCGSSRFVDIMAVCAWFIERDEGAVTMGLHLLPQWYCKGEIPDHLAEHEGVAERMDELHLRKIDMSDEIFVVDYKEYIGESTAREIEYAISRETKIRRYSSDRIGAKVDKVLSRI